MYKEMASFLTALKQEKPVYLMPICEGLAQEMRKSLFYRPLLLITYEITN